MPRSFTFTLAVSAAKGTKGSGAEVDLSPAFNVFGIYTDGMTYSTGGLDGTGFSYSAKLLTKARSARPGCGFKFGPANQPDAVGCNGQTVELAAGNFSSLTLLATGVQGS